MDADHSSCNVASSNVATDGASFPALLVVMDISEKVFFFFIYCLMYSVVAAPEVLVHCH